MSTLEISNEDEKRNAIEQVKKLSVRLNEREEVLKKLNDDLREAEAEMQEKVNEYKTRIAVLKDNIKNHTQSDSAEKKKISGEISSLKTAIAEYEVNKFIGASA